MREKSASTSSLCVGSHKSARHPESTMSTPKTVNLPLVKYPRTYHLPWSHPSSDDKVMEDVRVFEGQEVVVTVKVDGENTSLYRDFIHARSLERLTGETRGHVKAIHAGIAHEIPEGWRFCGENLYA